MPGAVSHTSTWALTNTTMGYAVRIANNGIVAAAKADPAVRLGINTYGGGVTYGPVAAAHKMEHLPIEKALG
jgi:alanine dehydrogenase